MLKNRSSYWIFQAVLVFTILVLPLIVSAQGAVGNQGLSFQNPLKVNSIEGLVSLLMNLVTRVGAIAAVFFFIYGGFLYVSAGGDEEKVAKAHSTLKWTAVGTAVLLGASALATLIKNTANSLAQ